MNGMPFYVMEYCPGPYLYGAGRPPGDTPPAETSAPEICSTHPERGEGRPAEPRVAEHPRRRLLDTPQVTLTTPSATSGPTSPRGRASSTWPSSPTFFDDQGNYRAIS